MITCDEIDDFLFVTTQKETGFVGKYEDTELTIRKWAKQKIYVKIHDYDVIKETQAELITELENIVAEINILSTDTKLYLQDIEKDLPSVANNMTIYLTDANTFVNKSKEKHGFELKSHVFDENQKVKNQGLFWFKFKPTNYISEAVVWANTALSNKNCQKHLLREELTQSLGMTNDLDDDMLESKDKNSIFNQKYQCDPMYNELDKRIISTFLSPIIKVGYTDFKVKLKLQKNLNCKRKQRKRKKSVLKKMASKEGSVSQYCEKCLKTICNYGEKNILNKCSFCKKEDNQILIKTFNTVCP